MKYHKLGSSDLLVSEVCLGTMTFGEQVSLVEQIARIMRLLKPEMASQNSEQESHELLDAAFRMGVNFIDTAEIYPVPPTRETAGRTEKFIGTWYPVQVIGASSYH